MNEAKPPPDDPLAGTAYRSLSQSPLGRGGMGEVVLAEHRSLGTLVVVKILHAKWQRAPDVVKRMEIEARSLAATRSPYLVQVTDFGQTPAGRTFLVMEHLVGRNLSEELAARGSIPVAEAVGILIEVLEGLEAAHAKGFIHRDVKGANVFLCDPTSDTPRRAKLLDFGIAKVVEVATGVARPDMPQLETAQGELVGTPRIYAPEQAYGRPVDARTDVYSAGLLLYTLIVGRGPYAHIKAAHDLLMAAAMTPADPPSKTASQTVPRAVDAAVLRALAKNPNDRFPSARAFADELRAIVATLADDEDEQETALYRGVKPLAEPPAPPAASHAGPMNMRSTVLLPRNPPDPPAPAKPVLEDPQHAAPVPVPPPLITRPPMRSAPAPPPTFLRAPRASYGPHRARAVARRRQARNALRPGSEAPRQ